MEKSEFGGVPPHEVNDFTADELPAIEQTAVDKEAITERILDHVIAAAETNRPLEAEYEKSHEIKDQQVGGVSYAPMQSVRDIMQNTAVYTQNQQSSVNPNDPVIGSSSVNYSPQVSSSSDSTGQNGRQMIKYGFVAGIIASAIIIVAIW